MLNEIFDTIFNMSITGGYIIIAIIFARLIIRKAPKKFSYLLWSVAAFRLAVPVSFQSVFNLFSLNPFNNTTVQTTENGTLEYIPPAANELPVLNNSNVISSTIQNNNAPAEISILDRFEAVFPKIWLAVMLAIILYGVISYITLKIKMRNAILKEKNIYESEKVSSPFILGFISPKIYIPFGIDNNTYTYIIAHENCHLKRYDYYIKMFAFILLAVHWFNPLCWVAFALVTADMEMSCDEKVLNENDNIRKEYSTAILSFAVDKKFSSTTPLCFSENSVKARIKNVLKFRKPRLAISIITGILCLTIIIGCALNPPKETFDEIEPATESEVVSDNNNLDSLITESILNNEKQNHIINNSYLGENHHIFGTADGDLDGNNSENYITVYAYAKIVNLTEKNDILTKLSEGAHPCAIVFQKDKNGYIFDTYWTPREDIEYFQNDINSTFPEDILTAYNEFMSDFQTYNNTISSMKQKAYAQVMEKYNLNISLYTDAAFKSFDTPGFSSNPGDYLDKSSDAYTFLMDNKDYTIRYIYSRFLEGGQYDIYGQFYRIVMDDITGEVLKIAVYSGQEYFNEFLKYNQYLLKENGEEFMKANYPYGYMLIEMMNNNGNTMQIQIIATQMRAAKSNDFKSDDSITEMISTITNSEYIDKFGNGINIYKFRYNEYITFYVSFDNTNDYMMIGVTYYLNDWEYAYQNFSNPFENLEITTQSTDNKSDESENIAVITPREAMKQASNEVKKQKYSEYFYRLRDNDILPSLSYRPIINDYDFVYNDNTEYVYTVGLSINEDDDTYNSCAVMIDAESGEIIAVKFFNSYDMV